MRPPATPHSQHRQECLCYITPNPLPGRTGKLVGVSMHAFLRHLDSSIGHPPLPPGAPLLLNITPQAFARADNWRFILYVTAAPLF